MLQLRGTRAATDGSGLHRDFHRSVVGSGMKGLDVSAMRWTVEYHTSAYPELAFWNNNLTYGSALGLKNIPNDPTAILNRARDLVTDRVVRFLKKEFSKGFWLSNAESPLNSIGVEKIQLIRGLFRRGSRLLSWYYNDPLSLYPPRMLGLTCNIDSHNKMVSGLIWAMIRSSLALVHDHNFFRDDAVQCFEPIFFRDL